MGGWAGSWISDIGGYHCRHFTFHVSLYKVYQSNNDSCKLVFVICNCWIHFKNSFNHISLQVLCGSTAENLDTSPKSN